jgi:hypothetical protein
LPKIIAPLSSTAQPATTTQRTPMLINSRATLAASRLPSRTVRSPLLSFAPAWRCVSTLPRWQQLRKDEFGHRFHGLDLGGSNQQTIGENDARAAPAIDVLLVENTVRRDVQQPIGLLVEAVSTSDGARSLPIAATTW